MALLGYGFYETNYESFRLGLYIIALGIVRNYIKIIMNKLGNLYDKFSSRIGPSALDF